jgi:hypothetical protein
MALVSMIFSGTWMAISQRQISRIKSKALDSRNLVLMAAVRNTRIGPNYYQTVKQNSAANGMFIKCMLGNIDDGQGNDCFETGGPYPMNLITDASASPVEHVFGPATNPAYYDQFGNVCASPSRVCPFQVFGGFTASCSAPPHGAITPTVPVMVVGGPCPQALTIEVTVTVQVDPSVQDLFIDMHPLTIKHVVAISDYWNYYDPIFPPVTDQGAPVSTGGGYGGFIVNLVLGPGSGGGGGSAGSSSTGAAGGCGAGQLAQGLGGCSTFSF